jgi:hypothetical protein
VVPAGRFVVLGVSVLLEASLTSTFFFAFHIILNK